MPRLPAPFKRGGVAALLTPLFALGTLPAQAEPVPAEPAPQAPAERTIRTEAEHIGLHIDLTWYGMLGGFYGGAKLQDATIAITGMVLVPLVLNGVYATVDGARPLPKGLPRALSAGMRLGLVAAIPSAILIEEAAGDPDPSLDRIMASFVGLPVLGAALGGVLWHQLDPQYTTTRAVECGGLWGSMVGLFAGRAAGPAEDKDGGGTTAATLGMATGLGVGAVAGGVLASTLRPRDAVITGTHLGAVGGLFLAGLVGQQGGAGGLHDDPRALAAITGAGVLLGGGLGAWLGSRYTEDDAPEQARWQLVPRPDGLAAMGTF